MRIIKYLQLPFNFDVARLKQEVQALEKISWQLHYQKLHYEGEWTALPLRSVDGNAKNIFVSPIPGSIYQDTIFLQESPYLQQVLSTFECPLRGVRLLKLDAGAMIKEHHDAELCYEKGEIRLHIPVTTHEDVEFYLDKERMNLKEGECWYMNFNLLHSIHNKSNINRIHLVIDAEVNDWVKALFSREDLTAKKEQEEKQQFDLATQLMIIARFREMNTETTHRLADNLEMKIKTREA